MPKPSFSRVSLAPPVLLLAGLLILGGCSTFEKTTQGVADKLTIYTPDVVQGNFVSREQGELLRPGMSRLQVSDLLGTPLLTDVFHADRWDYVFTFKRRRQEVQQYRLTLYFSGDVLQGAEGVETLPSEEELVDHLAPRRTPKVPQLEATEEQLQKFEVPAEIPGRTEQTQIQPAAGGYPPLESQP